jgi:medium-chain acyl-[acyl-carrier-protein] hydrolase
VNPPQPLISASFNSNHWFVCSQLKPKARIRLFLFPYAGGSPAVFSKWYKELPHSVEAWVAHYPGRGSRHAEPPINRIIPLVEKLSEAIKPLLDRPFAFFGHSMGGLVAFELTRLLRQTGLPQPLILFVSACSAPHIPDTHPPIHSLPDMEFLEALQLLNGIPSEFLQLPDEMGLFLPTLRADFESIESYQYTPGKFPLKSRIIAFGGLDDLHISRAQLESWASYTNSSFKTQYFPGDHFFIKSARESVIASIAAEIKA